MSSLKAGGGAATLIPSPTPHPLPALSTDPSPSTFFSRARRSTPRRPPPSHPSHPSPLPSSPRKSHKVARSLLREFEDTTEDEVSGEDDRRPVRRDPTDSDSGPEGESSTPPTAVPLPLCDDPYDDSYASSVLPSSPVTSTTSFPVLSGPPSGPRLASFPRLTSASPPPRTTSAPVTSAVSSPPTSPTSHVIVRGCYLLTEVDRILAPPGRTFLSVNLSPQLTSPTTSRGIQIVQEEAVIRHLPLDSIERCTAAPRDPHVILVATRTRVGGEEGTQAVEFRLTSHLDAQHVVALVNRLITPAATPCPPPPIRTHECTHKGWIEQWTPQLPEEWSLRYARHFTHRLLFYRSPTSSLPLHVFPLPSSDDRAGVTIGANEEGQFVIEFPADKMGANDVVWRCVDSPSHTQWMAALQLTPVETDSLTSPASPSASALAEMGLPPAPPPIDLQPTLSSQKAFMSYLFELSVIKPLFPSSLITSSSFIAATPGSFLRKRNPALTSIDASLASYHLLLSSLSTLWSEARLVMVDEYEQSGSSQIGFCFPGFDSQVFDVGRLSVIACAQLLSAESHLLRFNATDYQLAIESSSPAKEMMQSSPDFSSLYASGHKERAKSLAAQSQRLLLHHCSLASYMKAHQHEVQNGDTMTWADVILSVQGQRNKDLQRVFLPVSYLYNPSTVFLHDLIVALKAKEVDLTVPYRSFPCLSATSPILLSAPVGSDRATTAAVSPSPRRGFFGRKGKGEAESSPASPTVSSTPTPTPGSPLTPSSPRLIDGELRCLCDPVHLLLLLRTLLHYRRHALSTLLSVVGKTLPFLSSSNVDKVAMGCVEGLKSSAEVERSRVVFVLSVLPKAEEIEREVRRERRERREKRAEQEARRQAMKEKEREHSLQHHILTAKQAIDAFEREEGSDEEGEGGREEVIDDTEDDEVGSAGSAGSNGVESSKVEAGNSDTSEDSPRQTPMTRGKGGELSSAEQGATVYYL